MTSTRPLRTARPEVTLVIPVRDEELTLARLEDRLVNFAPGAEILFVDDASRDRSLAHLRAIASRDPRFRVISLAHRVGREKAIAAGLDHARGRAVITMGIEHPAETIQALVEKWREGYDVVYARSVHRITDGFFSRAPARIYDGIMADLVPIGTPLDTGDVRLVSRRVIKRLRGLPDRHRTGMPAWVGFRQIAIENDGAGAHRSFGKLVRAAIDATISFSDVPLRFASYLAFLAFGATVLLGLVAVVLSFTRPTVPTWILTVTALSFFSSLQLLALGALGGYVARLGEGVRRRPLYVTAEKINFGKMRARASTRDFSSGGGVEVAALPPGPSRPPPPSGRAPAFPSAPPPPPPVPVPAPIMQTAPMPQAPTTPQAPPAQMPSRPPPNVVASPAAAPGPSALGSKPPPALPSRTKTVMGGAPAVVPLAPKPAPIPKPGPSRPLQTGTMAGLGLPSSPPPAPAAAPAPAPDPPPPPPPPAPEATPPSSEPHDDSWDSTEAYSSQPHTIVSPPQIESVRAPQGTHPDSTEETNASDAEEKVPDSTPTAVQLNPVPQGAIRPLLESRSDDEDSPTRVGPPPSTTKE